MKLAYSILLLGAGLHAAAGAAAVKDVPTTTMVYHMSSKSNAAAVQSWGLMENGHVGHKYNLVAGKRYDFTVNAFGMPLDGVYPELRVLVNNVLVKTLTVDSASLKAYTFTYDATATAVHAVRIEYVNDARDDNENRNVFLHSLSIDNTSCGASTQLLTFQNFDSPTLPNSNGWSFGAQEGGTVSISTDRTKNFRGSAGSIRGTYPVTAGGMYVWGSFDISQLNANELFIEFYAKMPKDRHGFKFLKVFGKRLAPANYSNTTFGLNYHLQGGTSGFSFGDGTTPENDAQNMINYDGSTPDWIGRSYRSATVATPQNSIWAGTNWGTDWHHFKMRVKYNSGTTAANQIADGAYYVEIDGKVYAEASGVFNRHYSNGTIEKVAIFDWAQGGNPPFEIWYDDIKITTGGFSSCGTE